VPERAPEPRAVERPAPASPRPRAVPGPPPRRPSAPAASQPASAQPVARLSERSRAPQQWNLWDLERIARAESRRSPGRADEWAPLILHLRQFAEPGGTLPGEFDGLVRESFGNLLERIER